MQNLFKKYTGRSDRWFLILGIPFVAFILNTMMFGYLIHDSQFSLFNQCFIVSLSYTIVYWAIFRYVFLYFYTKYPGISNNKYRRFITVNAIIILFVIMLILDSNIVEPYLNSAKPDMELDFTLKTISKILITTLVLSIYESKLLTIQLQQSELEKQEIKEANISSELSGLKEQINPHFLFNSLNTLSSLVHEDSNRADAFIGKLASVYRYILDKNTEQKVQLRDELSFLQSYIHLMKERFGDSLIVSQSINTVSLDKYIIPLCMQLTFENCIKHNFVTKDKPLHIEIFTDEEMEYIYIKNNLQKTGFTEQSSKVGLENIRKRCNYFTDKDVIILENGSSFLVGIPLI